MADLFYMSEKFGVAVHHLAVTDAPLRDRVRHAYLQSARFGTPDLIGGHPGMEPSRELADRVRALHERVTADGTYDTSFSVMSDDEVKAIAEEIYDIDLHIQSEKDQKFADRQGE